MMNQTLGEHYNYCTLSQRRGDTGGANSKRCSEAEKMS